MKKMTAKQIELLTDLAGLILWAILTKQSWMWVLVQISHDLGGWIREDKLQLPRSTGYWKSYQCEYERQFVNGPIGVGKSKIVLDYCKKNKIPVKKFTVNIMNKRMSRALARHVSKQRES